MTITTRIITIIIIIPQHHYVILLLILVRKTGIKILLCLQLIGNEQERIAIMMTII